LAVFSVAFFSTVSFFMANTTQNLAYKLDDM
jgi:hypothetical protein